MISKRKDISEVLHREPLEQKWVDYKWPLLFLVSMSLMGLKFPLGYIFVPLILINRFKEDRYDFLIMLTLFFGGYGFIGENTIPVKPWDIGFVISLICALLYKKKGIIGKTLFIIVLYAVALLAIASFSDESMMVQIRTIRNYLCFVYFVIPLALFSDRRFDIKEFFLHLMPFVVIISAFYVLDCYVINGHVLVPCTHNWSGRDSVFYNPLIFSFGTFPRKYPPGLFLAVLAVFPIARYYRLPAWQWVLYVVTMGACRTFTVITGFIVEYFWSLSKIGQLLKYIFIVIAFGLIIYGVDALLPTNQENGESTLRIYSSVQQILDLRDAVDDEDIAELGSGRLGQAIPKMELVSEYDKTAVGLGFLHPQLTTNPKYIIYNTYYENTEEAEEVSTGIEIEPLQVYVACGYVGLTLHILFFVITCIFVRRMKYYSYYLCVLVTLFWFGLGGFAQLNAADGLFIASLAYAVVILANKEELQLS